MKNKLLITGAILISILLLGILTYKKEEKNEKFTTVKIDNNPFDFGTISEKDTINHVFKITNTSKKLFVIDQVLPSCTCTVSKTDSKICRLNESVNIEVTFYPKQKGKVNTIVYVQCNAEKGVIKLELKGNIK